MDKKKIVITEFEGLSVVLVQRGEPWDEEQYGIVGYGANKEEACYSALEAMVEVHGKTYQFLNQLFDRLSYEGDGECFTEDFDLPSKKIKVGEGEGVACDLVCLNPEDSKFYVDNT